MTGRLIGVVGPSGVGKDTLMNALSHSSPEFEIVRRVITRSGDLGGEDFEAVSEAEFERRRIAGAFCVHWNAHGLRYGIPYDVRVKVGKGQQLLVNLSRDVLVDVALVFPIFSVLHVTARPETLAARLLGRGRETEDEIARRLERAARPLPSGLTILTVSNDGALEETVDEALALLHPVRV